MDLAGLNVVQSGAWCPDEGGFFPRVEASLHSFCTAADRHRGRGERPSHHHAPRFCIGMHTKKLSRDTSKNKRWENV